MSDFLDPRGPRKPLFGRWRKPATAPYVQPDMRRRVIVCAVPERVLIRMQSNGSTKIVEYTIEDATEFRDDLNRAIERAGSVRAAAPDFATFLEQFNPQGNL